MNEQELAIKLHKILLTHKNARVMSQPVFVYNMKEDRLSNWQDKQEDVKGIIIEQMTAHEDILEKIEKYKRFFLLKVHGNGVIRITMLAEDLVWSQNVASR